MRSLALKKGGENQTSEGSTSPRQFIFDQKILIISPLTTSLQIFEELKDLDVAKCLTVRNSATCRSVVHWFRTQDPFQSLLLFACTIFRSFNRGQSRNLLSLSLGYFVRLKQECGVSKISLLLGTLSNKRGITLFRLPQKNQGGSRHWRCRVEPKCKKTSVSNANKVPNIAITERILLSYCCLLKRFRSFGSTSEKCPKF